MAHVDQRPNMCQCEKFHQNQSNAIYTFFKMAAVRHVGFVRHVLELPTKRTWWNCFSSVDIRNFEYFVSMT